MLRLLKVHVSSVVSLMLCVGLSASATESPETLNILGPTANGIMPPGVGLIDDTGVSSLPLLHQSPDLGSMGWDHNSLSLIVKHEFQGIGAITESGQRTGEILGSTVLTTVTATCIFFEIIGPILTKYALNKAGEINVYKLCKYLYVQYF
ncbi:MAG: hypothetical protein HRU15_12675 [Planctomycetes bacterium]|nr:hypothetical protein [Planctomycetota bacterium]